MVRVIYGDVLLLIDFCMNFFVLYTSAIVLRRKVKAVCIGSAALVGGIYSVAKVFIEGNEVIDCIITFCVGLLLCYMCFGTYKFLKVAVVFYSVSSLVGGMMFGIYYFLGSYHKDIYGYAIEYAYSHLPIWLFVTLAAISMIISWFFAYAGRDVAEKNKTELLIEYLGKSIKVKVLLDSGNLVKEPISGKYVIFVTKEKARALFDDDTFDDLVNKNTENLLKKKFRIISTAGIDGKNSVYFSVLPEKIVVIDEKHYRELDAYVAVCRVAFHENECDGIAHPALLG